MIQACNPLCCSNLVAAPHLGGGGGGPGFTSFFQPASLYGLSLKLSNGDSMGRQLHLGLMIMEAVCRCTESMWQ